jgi:PilZ domain
MGTEKRGCLRKKAPSISATVHDASGYYNAMVSDLSLKGISLFVSKDHIQHGERYELKFSLPVKGKYLPVHLEGSAVYAAATGSMGAKVGFQVASIDTLSLWTLEAFLKAPLVDEHASIGYQWNSPRIL